MLKLNERYGEMTTRILQPNTDNLTLCAAHLRAGGLVAFPTETVYALGAVATDERAVARLYEVKKRPLDKPLIVAVSKKSEIGSVVKNIPKKAEKLIDEFMPGALTLLLDRADRIPDIVTAGGGTVAVRIPACESALKLIELTGAPVVVPSANISEKTSPTLASHVLDDFGGKIEYILDGGACDIGIESTIIDTRCDPPKIIRCGGVAVPDIERVIGKVEYKREDNVYGNYIPAAEVMFSAYYDGMTQNICSRYDELVARGRKTVIICLDGNAAFYGDRRVYTLGGDYKSYAHNLFAALRRADAEHMECVIAEGVKPEGMGVSIINRLCRISRGQII